MKTSVHWLRYEDDLLRRLVPERRKQGVRAKEWAEELASMLSGRTPSAVQQRASTLRLLARRKQQVALTSDGLATQAELVELKKRVSVLENALLTIWTSLGDALGE